jgi:hypothetical protein
VNRPSAGQATGLAGTLVGAAAITGLIGGIELNRQPHAEIWSNAWILTTVLLAAIAVLVVAGYFIASLFAHEEAKRGEAAARTDEPQETQTEETSPPAPADSDMAGPIRVAPVIQQIQASPVEYHLDVPAGTIGPVRREPTFTGCWRYTADGFDASPLMNMINLAMPGFMIVRGQEPQIRIGMSVACAPIPAGVSSSLYGAKLVEFLRRDPVATLMGLFNDTDEWPVWTRQAGNGALSLEAVMTIGDGDYNPVASALLQPPVTGLRLYGRNEGVACLWLHIDPRGASDIAEAAGLIGWHRRFQLAMTMTGAFAEFLTNDLGLQTSEEPAARVGVLIEPVSDLVDAGSLPTLPGGVTSNQFLGYAIADRDGRSADLVAGDLLRQLCDHNLHLADFEDVLESVGAAPTVASRPASRQPQRVQSTWETREVPVLRAVVKLLDQPSSFQATVSQISKETGIDKADVDRAIEALEGEYIANYERFLTGGDPSTWAVRGITSKARRAVGQWPDE